MVPYSNNLCLILLETVAKPSSKQSNILPLWGNERTMNLNPLILTNIQSSHYFKGMYLVPLVFILHSVVKIMINFSYYVQNAVYMLISGFLFYLVCNNLQTGCSCFVLYRYLD